MPVSADYQYEFRNFLFGALTNYKVERVDGLLGSPRVNSTDADRPSHHGGIPGRHTMQRRVIQMTIKTAATPRSDIENRIDAIVQAFTPSSAITEYQLLFQRPGHGVRWTKARVTRAPQPTSSFELTQGLGEFVTELVASDPRIYSGTAPLSQVITVTAGSTSQSAAVANSTQTWDDIDQFQGSPPLITIAGPAVNPRIANLEAANRSIKTTVNLLAGQTLTIDVAKREVRVNGVLSYSIIPDDNQWWEMMKGTNNITFSRTGTTGSPTCTIAWYPAHMR